VLRSGRPRSALSLRRMVESASMSEYWHSQQLGINLVRPFQPIFRRADLHHHRTHQRRARLKTLRASSRLAVNDRRKNPPISH